MKTLKHQIRLARGTPVTFAEYARRKSKPAPHPRTRPAPTTSNRRVQMEDFRSRMVVSDLLRAVGLK